jgi:hypothetical protein
MDGLHAISIPYAPGFLRPLAASLLSTPTDVRLLITAEEVLGVQRYLLVLDTDWPIGDEELRRGLVSHLAARNDQEPNEVVVLSLAGPPRGSGMELLLGAGYP